MSQNQQSDNERSKKPRDVISSSEEETRPVANMYGSSDDSPWQVAVPEVDGPVRDWDDWDIATSNWINDIKSWLDGDPPRLIKNSRDLVSLKENLIKGVNEVNRLLEQAQSHPVTEVEYHHKAAHLCCRMLEELLYNKHFRNAQAEASLGTPFAIMSGHMAAGLIGAAASEVWSYLNG